MLVPGPSCSPGCSTLPLAIMVPVVIALSGGALSRLLGSLALDPVVLLGQLVECLTDLLPPEVLLTVQVVLHEGAVGSLSGSSGTCLCRGEDAVRMHEERGKAQHHASLVRCW